MQFLTQNLESLGYRWAYRTIDTRAFGLPQRRLRVFLLASRSEDPRQALFSDDAGEEGTKKNESSAYGFYWTEGNRGLGWASEAVPTLKGGSGCGIPSPPGIWVTGSRSIITPDVRDAERLQGLPPDWTKPAEEIPRTKRGTRWRLVGNAVSVPVSAWLGTRLMTRGRFDESSSALIRNQEPWPPACWGESAKRYAVPISSWPVRKPARKILEFLRYPTVPLSARATSGFLCRARSSRLSFVDGFLNDVAYHLRQMDPRGQFPDRFTNGRAKK
jgi:DNA (cytosine-5)-methyltransferase 1